MSEQRMTAQDILNRMNGSMYKDAKARRMSLTGFLEQLDPSSGYNDGLDSFERLCKIAGIRTCSVPEQGIYADTFEKFDATDQTRALVPEWVARQWRRATTVNTRASLTLDDAAPGTTQHPWADATMYRAKALAPAIPLSELVAFTTTVDTDAYRAYYLTDDASNQRMVRVAQGAELPRAKLTGGDHAIQLYKYGRSLEITYEALRRMPIDKLSIFIQRLAIQVETDKVAAILDVMINGDGNANTAATNYNLTTLDPDATAGTLTLPGWLAFKMKFANPYVATTVIAQEADALQLNLLSVGSANVPAVMIANQSGLGSFTAINRGLADGARLGWTSDAPTLKLVAFDRSLAIERVIEAGANIMEVDKWIARQTQLLAMSEMEGYSVFDQNAIKTLDINA